MQADSSRERQIIIDSGHDRIRYRIDYAKGEDNLDWYSERLDVEGEVIGHDTHDLAEVLAHVGGSPDSEADDHSHHAATAIEMHRGAIDHAEQMGWPRAASRLRIDGEVAAEADWS